MMNKAIVRTPPSDPRQLCLQGPTSAWVSVMTSFVDGLWRRCRI